MSLQDGRDLDLFILRHSPVLVGISQSGGTATVVISVGGSEVAFNSTAVPSWSPDRVVFGEWDSANSKSVNLCPMLWYGGRMDETSASDAAQMTDDLQSLAMLYQKAVPLPPGLEML